MMLKKAFVSPARDILEKEYKCRLQTLLRKQFIKSSDVNEK
jgi:hypothetical protein